MRRAPLVPSLAAILATGAAGALAACGGDDTSTGTPDAAATVDAAPAPDANPCPRAAAPADRARKVVVSLPYDAGGGQASTWTVLDLAADGTPSGPTGAPFTMGRATRGAIAFTPDGEVGLVAQDDGSLGVFRFDGDTPVVVHARFTGSFYAERVVVDPAGDLAYVIDPNWRNNGGGIYRVAIGCDGSLTDLGLWFPTKLAAGLHLRGERAVLVATDVGDSPAGDTVDLLDWTTEPPGLLDGDPLFPDDQAIVAATAMTANGRHVLVGDNSEFSGLPNRVAVAAVAGDAVTTTQVITPVEDPVAIVASPFDDAALVVSGYGDAVFVLDYAPDAATPFTLRGEVAYAGAAPQLPGDAVMVDRGGQRGLVLIAELAGVRRMRFGAGATVTDLGLQSTGTGYTAITGAIGVQP